MMGKPSTGPGEIPSELGSVGAGVETSVICGDLQEPSGTKAGRWAGGQMGPVTQMWLKVGLDTSHL